MGRRTIQPSVLTSNDTTEGTVKQATLLMHLRHYVKTGKNAAPQGGLG